jgi:hypothetical protein
MYVNWKVLVVLAVVAVAGYVAYQKFVVDVDRYGKMSTPQLLESYNTSNDVDRALIAKEFDKRLVVNKLNPDDLRAWLKRKEDTAGYQVACEYLGRAHDRKSVDVLLKDLQHNSPKVRIGASYYFQNAPAQRAFDLLVKNIDHTSGDVQRESVVALKKLAEMTTIGVKYGAEPTKWREWWEALPKAEKSKIPE